MTSAGGVFFCVDWERVLSYLMRLSTSRGEETAVKKTKQSPNGCPLCMSSHLARIGGVTLILCGILCVVAHMFVVHASCSGSANMSWPHEPRGYLTLSSTPYLEHSSSLLLPLMVETGSTAVTSFPLSRWTLRTTTTAARCRRRPSSPRERRKPRWLRFAPSSAWR